MYKLTFEVDDNWKDLTLGESIAVNGVCLTVTEFSNTTFSADVSIPTLKDSTLGSLSINREVNLERSLKLSDRLGGHIVQGHVDGTGRVISVVKKDDNLIIKIHVEKMIHELVALKASIAVDGVSLTVQDVGIDDFKIVIIPHSCEKTILEKLRVGDAVNIEADLFAKYAKHFLKQDVSDKSDKDLKAKLSNFLY